MDELERAFMDALATAHQGLDPAARLSVSAPADPAAWVEAGVLQIADDHIVALDVRPLAQHYLLWTSLGLERLPHLRRLTLADTQFDELDLAGATALQTVVLAGLARDPLQLNLAECPALEALDLSAYRATADGQTTTLCVRPEQIGPVVPADIEDRFRDEDDFLTLKLAIAPPGHPDVAGDPLPLRYLVRYEAADLGQVLRGYWSLRPEYYTRYATPEDARDTERDNFALIVDIEAKVARGFFTGRDRPFDPADFHGENLREREVHDTRPIPACMYEPVLPRS